MQKDSQQTIAHRGQERGKESDIVNAFVGEQKRNNVLDRMHA